ncbi:MAG TPA: glycoside hydrolase family 3 C-terminal domain-containing protein [Anaerolineales bacterium]|nr:glycoside hydrolase family 3 C-terminal domain-containing protein [Anaerolineales bacterium]
MTDIDKLIKQMTLEEKISLLAGADLWHTVAIPRLGIPAIKMTDGPNGARGAWGNMGPASALFPIGTALGATWNTELVERIGAALADEVKAKGAHILLAPTVNIHRTPIAGRNFECYSEDPYLTGKMATAYIRGMQNNGAGACIKHFVCNDQEFERMSISAKVEERPLREIYLEPFRLAIRDAKPWAVMSSYNKVNGVFASENDDTLKKILKDEWGFEGLVMSDWFGTYTDNVPAGGLDLEMPGPARWMTAEKVKAALKSGALTQAALDDKVRRILRIVERAGAFENPKLQKEKSEDKPEHRAVIREAAREAIVLLSNKDNLLPLDPAKVKTVAVIGELAEYANVLGGGSSRVSPHYIISPLDGIRARAGKSIKVEYEIGCFAHKRMPRLNAAEFTSDDGKRGLTMRLYSNLDFSGKPAYEEVTDRSTFEWLENSVPNVDPARFCMRLSGTFISSKAGAHTFGLSSIGKSRLFLDNELLVDNWEANQPNLEKTAEKQLKVGQKVAVKVEFLWEGNPRWRSIRVSHLAPIPADPMAEAVALAKHADVAIVVAGLTNDWESEGYDRVDINLPGQQNELIEKVAAANPNTIVVLNAGSPVTMPWADKVSAILDQWYNSQECGNALADVLFGDVSPSGKLPTTFPVRYEDNPAFLNYPGENGQVLYGEGLFVGYRYYDAKKIAPLFPFGHGLSYTTFEYSNIKLGAPRFTAEEGLDISFDIRNTGKRAGKEISQVYVHDKSAGLVRPEKELKAFSKVELAPGQSKTIILHLDREAFWYYHPARGGWIVEPGEFEILVGGSSHNLPLRATATLIPAPKATARLTTESTLRAILDNDAGKAALTKHFGEWMSSPDLQAALDHSIEQIAALVPQILTKEKMQALSDDLAKA